MYGFFFQVGNSYVYCLQWSSSETKKEIDSYWKTGMWICSKKSESLKCKPSVGYKGVFVHVIYQNTEVNIWKIKVYEHENARARKR